MVRVHVCYCLLNCAVVSLFLLAPVAVCGFPRATDHGKSFLVVILRGQNSNLELLRRQCAGFCTCCTGGGKIPRGDFSAGKIPYFNLVRNFPLIFRGEVRNFPRAEFCPCKPPYHRMPCASPRAPICFVPALLQLLSTNREGGAGSRIICEWRATPSTEVISGTMVIAFSQDLLGIAIPGSLLLPMH